jgi:hypothetical protein
MCWRFASRFHVSTVGAMKRDNLTVYCSDDVSFEVFTTVTMSSGMLRRVALVRTDVSEDLSTSFQVPPKRRF